MFVIVPWFTINHKIIEERNPLKQGLKQNMRTCRQICIQIEERNPLKQGLKPMKQVDVTPGQLY